MSKISKIAYYIVTFIFFVFFDFYFSNFILKYGWQIPTNPVLNLTYVRNDGAAFNIFQDARLFLILFSLIALGYIGTYVIRNISKLSSFLIFCSSMLCAGIFCNMYERIAYGFVRDFFDLKFIDFPVFNISDIFISISVFAIVIIIIKSSYFKNHENNSR